jgi:transposase-like protein
MAPANEARELMKKVRFTEEQMVTILREADRSPVAEVAKKHKVSEQTIYVWRRRFGKLEPADMKRLRELEAENAKLKRMVADKELAIETLKEINRRKW